MIALLEWQMLKNDGVAYAPWWAQRLLASSLAPIRCCVAARQTGKSTQAAHEVVKTMSLRPRSTSCILMPTVKSTVGPLKQLRAALERAHGPEGGRWSFRKQEGVFRLWNGAELYVRTCDAEAKEGVPVRGMTIDGILWVDEAAYVPASAWNAARGMLLAVRDPKILVTGTPCGKTWLYDLFKSGIPGPKRDPMVESFRFKAAHSPFATPDWLASERKRLGPKLALQELDAVFLGDGGSVFTDAEIDRMLVAAAELPIRGEQRTLGVDVGIDRDFTVLVLMNEFGESWILARFRDVQISGIVARVQEEAERHDALVVVDVGQGGGHGGALASLLVEKLREHSRLPAEGRVLKVRTGNPGVKSEVVVTFQTAVQNDRVKLAAGEHVETVRNEFRFFEGHKSIVAGSSRWSFSGPKSTARGTTLDGSDEDHDDTVLAVALANWGKEHGWTDEGGGTSDFSAFKTRGAGGARPTRGTGVPDLRSGPGARAGGAFFR
jgi:hypothetical protein